MRTISSDLLSSTALESYTFKVNGTIEPSRVYFSSLTSGSPAFADVSGLLNTPVLQEIGFSSGSPAQLATFYNDGGSLKYQIPNDSDVIDTSQSITGKPGVFGDYIYLVSGGTLYRYTISWSAVASKSSGILSGSTSIDGSTYSGLTAIFCHAVSSGVVVIAESDGGFKSHYHTNDGGWQRYDQPNRFMFPRAIDYTSGSPSMERSMTSLGTFSSAVKLGDEVFAYMSNCAIGNVEGIVLSPISKTWSDIFVAVPSELSASMSEFRLANAFTSGSAAYLVGQFQRSEGATGYVPYTLVLKSTNGRTYSMEQASLIDQTGYRMLATVTNGRMYVTACNRTGDELASYLFRGTDDPIPEATPLTGSNLKSFSDNSLQQAKIDPAVGNEQNLYNPHFSPGARVLINAGYVTPNGTETVRYGTYIHSGYDAHEENGVRTMSPTLMGEGEYRLSSMSSPFYTQIISKSSVVDHCTDLHNLYVAPNCGLVEYSFSVDFWDAEPYDNAEYDIVGHSIMFRGGVGGFFSHPDHKYGIKGKETTDLLNTVKYPVVESSTVNVSIYGWSSDRDGSSNSLVGIILFLKDKTTLEESVVVQATSKRWPNTYLTEAAGDYPITYDITGLTVGLQITNVGLYFEQTSQTLVYPCRVDFNSGVKVYRDTASTAWQITSGSAVKLPGTGGPSIMFSSKPYDAFNFILSGSFHSNVTGYVSGSPCGYGLVGLAEDGANYVLGRFNYSNARMEIVKCRDREETVLTSGSPGWAVGQDLDLLFRHTDGHFSLSARNSIGEWAGELTYDWTEDDGFMISSITAIKHTGIYGVILMPYFYTTGLDIGSMEDGVNSDAIPLMPGQPSDVFASFPSSGNVFIEGIKYSYDGQNYPSDIRGPFQFRNNGEGDSAQYAPPFGSGQPGLECLDLDWTATNNNYDGYIIALDDGSNYECTKNQWQIWITTSGDRVDIPDRARYTAAGSLIAKMYHDLSNRVWITGGLMAPELVQGDVTAHWHNSLVELYHEGNIWCSEFRGSSGDTDVTIEDLIDRISRTCGAVARFPGDIVLSSFTPQDDFLQEDLNKVATKTYVNGFDIRFTIPILSTSADVSVISDVKARGQDYPQTSIELMRVSSGHYRLSLRSDPYYSDPLEKFSFEMPDTQHVVRVLYHDDFATVYIDEIWIYTFGIAPSSNLANPLDVTPGFTYADSVRIYLHSTPHITFTDITIKELSDWREAVYVDLETDGKSAIESVIQERPIEIWNNPDGSISYSYEPVRSTIVPGKFFAHNWSESFPNSAGSDSIVYYSDVKTYQFAQFAQDFGLSTRVIRMPNLTVGAVKATRILLKRIYQQGFMHTIHMRPDLRIQPGDIMSIVYNSPGSGTPWNVNVIVETISLTSAVGDKPIMIITGRENR